MTRILWRRHDVTGVEWGEVTDAPPGRRLDGLALVPWTDGAHRVEYEVILDRDNRTRHARVRDRAPGTDVEIELEADGAGTWRRDGSVIVSRPDALDVDLGFSPITNSLPIWRLALEVGESREIAVAWVQFPGLAVVEGTQTYTRLADRRWRYSSDSFAAELEVGEDGLVDRYGDIWTAIARE